MIAGFRTHIIFRVLLIVGITWVLVYAWLHTGWFFAPVILTVLLAGTVVELVFYIERTNRELTTFLLQVRQRDYTSSLRSVKRGQSFVSLSRAFNDVIREFERLDFQREAHFQYLQMLTDNMGVGIISFHPNGGVHLANPEALRILGTTRLVQEDDLKTIHPKIQDCFLSLRSGERRVVSVSIQSHALALSVQVKELRVGESFYRVILFQDINRELEDKEEEAWQRLIRVLTHEIMNSVTPVVSLTEAVNRLLHLPAGDRKLLSSLDADDTNDLYESLATIENRSKGLLRFVNAYKNIAQLPDVALQRVDVVAVLNHVIVLLRNPVIYFDPAGPVYAHTDPVLFEQVVINILRNAGDAVRDQEDGRINLTVRTGEKVVIQVSDNGGGIEPEILSKVFVPFFTTKKNGTGVGLSFSRQVMKLTGGQLLLTSERGKGTIVTLQLQPV